MNPSNRRRSSSAATYNASTMPSSARKDATRMKIEQMELERDQRRKDMIQRKEARKQEQLRNIAAGNPGDVDFIGMVNSWREKQQVEYEAEQSKKKGGAPNNSNICIAVRKRPLNDKERQKLDHDSVSCFAPKVWIHSAKLKVDGITKYLTHQSFQFDHAFGENSTTENLYIKTTLPLVDHVVSTQGRATVFCYGQTGSGKTYTMNGIQNILAMDLYSQLEEQSPDLDITVAFFELYGGFCQDLLHQRKRCKLLEDGKGEINITGLQEVAAETPEQFLRIIEEGHSLRTTHTTEANDTSSRSHAICQVFLRKGGKLKGKLTLVDLAGSERGSDTKSHNSQRRSESAEINTSLLSLKECIRALGQKSSHVPYRGSKLTLILKDCFSDNSKTTMIATVSPGASSSDHSLNTLRYAGRIKEQRTNSVRSKGSKAQVNKQRAQTGTNKDRLARIATAHALRNQQQQAVVIEALAEQNRTLSPTGLVESLSSEIDDCSDESSETKPTNEAKSSRSYLQDSFGGKEPESIPSVSQKTITRDPSQPTKEEEAELRRTVQAVFEAGEALLTDHLQKIQENTDMLTQEGKLIQKLEAGGLSEDQMDDYAIQLAEYLDRKEILISKLRARKTEFQKQLNKEQQLSARVKKLTQY